VTDIQATLDTTVVRPIFDSVHPNGHRDQSLPEVVFDNRQSRAYSRVLDALISRGAPTVPKDLRTRLESMIEAWSNQAFDDAFQPIQEFEIQCARERDLVMAEQSGDPRRVLEVRESEYRRKVAQRFGSIELRGIQLNHRVILDLDQVYVPLHFEKLGRKLGHITRNREGQLVLSGSRSRVPFADVIKESTRILLIGSPGSGKSTLLSFLASRCAVGNHGLSWPDRALPFVVTVRELKDAVLSPNWLAVQLEIEPDLVSAALSQERAVLLVDGLDEAPEKLRKQLVAECARFTTDHPRTPVIVTSRPSGAPGEVESCLPGFQGFRLADLTQSEVSKFIDRWCLAAERSARSDSSEGRREANAAAADLKSRIARSRPVQRIAVSPLLTTILCVVHRFLGRTIPEHRVTLYEKCTDALLYEWDRAKFPKDAAVGNLDANQKRALLRGVASALHEKHEAEIPESEVVRHFAAMLPQIGKPQEDALRIVREIRDRTGVLVERRPGAFAFSHLTFQEYLTALDYAPRSEQLLQHLADPWWNEVIALAVGIPGCDPVRIIRALLRRKDDDAVIMATKCLETAIHIPLDLRKEVEAALAGILPRAISGGKQLSEIGPTVAPILARDLFNFEAEGKTDALDFFTQFMYEPVIPLLVQLASATEGSGIQLPGGYGLKLGEYAIYVLCLMAEASESASRALTAVLSKPTSPMSEEFSQLLNPLQILSDDFKPSRLGKRSPKRAKNIA
jgi:hypothetical protein